ncbi:MAG TPA: hypothetical protein VJT78_04650 [Candidatus Dormibacteraeota bacterium]|nr:hypothetical protein [Candidatus Dormibacteraeota bacterium]
MMPGIPPRLNSPDVDAAPLIDLGLLTEPVDLELLAEGYVYEELASPTPDRFPRHPLRRHLSQS